MDTKTKNGFHKNGNNVPDKQSQDNSDTQNQKVATPQTDQSRAEENSIFEIIYKIILIISFFIGLQFIIDVIKFKEQAGLRGIETLGFQFLGQAMLSGFVLYMIKNGIRIAFYDLVFNNIRNQYKGKDREQRTQKVCKWIFDILFYTSMSLLSMYYFWDQEWFPFASDFNIDKNQLIKDYPVQPRTLDGKGKLMFAEFYYYVQLGNHFFATIDLIFIRRKDEHKFYEWLLHHVLATTLVLYSGYFNFWIYGIIVLQIHDIADIFVSFFKIYAELQNRNDTIFYLCVVSMEIVWFYTRLWLFPQRCIYTSMKIYVFIDKWAWDIAYKCYIYQQILMFILFFMHIYWFCIMIQMTLSQLAKEYKKNKMFKNTKEFHNNFDFRTKLQDEQSHKVD